MAARDLTCLVCHADLPLGGDERTGDEVFCTYCGAPFTLQPGSGVSSEEREGDEWQLEEDF